MLRIRRYLKPYWLMLVASIILLFIQAMLDLTLPDLLSQIVNTGVQAAGVETAVMSAMRQETMERITLFMSEEDASQVRNAYTLIDSDSPEFDLDLETYPFLAQEPIYVLKDMSQEEMDQLTTPIARALLVVSSLEQAMLDPEKAAQMGGGAFDLSLIPPGTDIFTAIGGLPSAQREQIAALINEQFAALGETVVNQTAIAQVRVEYEALSMDMAKLQTAYVLRVGAIMLVVTLLSAVCVITVGYFSAKIAAGTGRDLRSDVFAKVENFPAPNSTSSPRPRLSPAPPTTLLSCRW